MKTAEASLAEARGLKPREAWEYLARAATLSIHCALDFVLQRL